MTSADTVDVSETIILFVLSSTLCLADTVGQVLTVHIQGEAAPVLTLLRPRPPLCQPPLGAVLQLRAVAGHPLLLPARQVACNKQYYLVKEGFRLTEL